MVRNRVRRYALGLAGVALIPPLLWIGVVLIAPTAWARRHVAAALAASSGRSVALSGLTVPLLGGVEFRGLSFGSPKNTDDPWLKAEHVRLDVSACRLLMGKIGPCSIDIDGCAMRVLRRLTGASSWPTSSCRRHEKTAGGRTKKMKPSGSTFNFATRRWR